VTTDTTLRRPSWEYARDHPLPFGSRAPDFDLLEPLSGRRRTKAELDTNDVFAVFFVSNHCPHSVAWEGRLVDLARTYADHVAFAFISSNDPKRFPEDNAEEIAKRARSIGYPAPYLIDPDQSIADIYAAVRTPHAFVFRRDQGLVYRGTVDDNEEDVRKVTKHWLRDAIEAAIERRPVPLAETQLQGCSIKRKLDAAAGGR
jgi:hypothetical protein